LCKNDVALTPASEDLFVQKESTAWRLDEEKAEAFHTTTAQGLF